MKYSTAENLADTIAATVPREVTKPISELTAELDQCERAFTTLRDDFIARSLPTAFLDLTSRIKYKLFQSEDEWKKLFATTEEIKIFWDEKSPTGYIVRDGIKDVFKICLWHIPEVMKRIDGVSMKRKLWVLRLRWPSRRQRPHRTPQQK